MVTIYLDSSLINNWLQQGQGGALLKTGYEIKITRTVYGELSKNYPFQAFYKNNPIPIVEDGGGFVGPDRGERSIGHMIRTDAANGITSLYGADDAGPASIQTYADGTEIHRINSAELLGDAFESGGLSGPEAARVRDILSGPGTRFTQPTDPTSPGYQHWPTDNDLAVIKGRIGTDVTYHSVTKPPPPGFVSLADDTALTRLNPQHSDPIADLNPSRNTILNDPASYDPSGRLTPGAAAAMEMLDGVARALGIAATMYDIGATLADVLPHWEAGDMEYVNEEIGALIGRNLGGWAGALVGAQLGFELGSLAGPWGAVIGAIIGGAFYGYYGFEIGDTLGRDVGGLLNYLTGLLDTSSVDPSNWLTDIFGFLWIRSDPLVLDLDLNGVQLTSLATSTAHFDFDGDGFAERTGWVSPADGLLVRDLNGNGLIDDGSELFGTANQDGFTLLAAFDLNSDGMIDASDAIYPDLQIWKDVNQDGLTQPGELTGLAFEGVLSIDLEAAASKENWNGNSILFRGGFTMAAVGTLEIDAVSFATDRMNSVYQLPDGFMFDPEVFLLPNLRGYGYVPDLWVAMTLDSELKEMVQELVADAVDSFSSINGVIGEPYAIVVGGQEQWHYGMDEFEHMLARWAGIDSSNLEDVQVKLIAQDLLGRDLPFALGNPSFFSAFMQFSSDIAMRFYTQVPQLEENSFAYRISDALNNAVPADGIALTLAEVDALIAPIVASIEDPAPLDSDLEPFGLLRYDFVTDSIGGDIAGFIDAQLQSYDFDPDQPWQDFQSWYDNHVHVLLMVDPSGSVLEERHRAYTGNVDLPILRFAHGEVAGDATGEELFGDNGGVPANDLVEGKGGDDILRGGAGGDTYVFSDGSGADTVIDTSGTEDEIAFQGALTSSLAHFAFANGNRQDLLISFEGRGETVTVVGFFDVDGNTTIEKVTFADGYMASAREIRDFAYAGLATSGADTIDAFNTGTTVVGMAGNDRLTGRWGNDRLIGGEGNDSLAGSGGNDTYVFARGGGQDVVSELADIYSGWRGVDTLEFAAGISPSDIIVTQTGNGNDLVLAVDGTTDSVTLDHDVNDGYYRIEWVVFADGTRWSHADLMTMATSGTPGDDVYWGSYDPETISGAAGNDVIDGRHANDILIGGTGDDVLSGSGGADTYIFAAGDGDDIVREFVDVFSGNQGFDTIDFADGVAPASIVVAQADNGNDIILTNAITGDSVTLDHDVNDGWYRVERVRFADNTIWSHAELMTMAISGTPGNDVYWGSYDAETIAGAAGDDVIDARANNDILIGGTGNDVLSGSGGDDTYRFASGDGDDIVREFVDVFSGNQGFDTIEFADGIAPAHLVVTQADNGNDIVLTNVVTGDSVTLDHDVNDGWYRVERVRFADNTIWSHADLMAKATAPTAGNDLFWGGYESETLEGGAGNDTIDARGGNDILIGGAGDDFLRGSGGDDVYRFGRGDGRDWAQDYIASTSGWGGFDRLELGAGITPADISIGKADNGGSYIVYVDGGEDAMTLVGAVSWGNNYAIEEVRFADGTAWQVTDLEARAGTIGMNADTILGTSADESLRGLGGDDQIDGGAGNDVLKGDGGSDQLLGGAGDDSLAGGAGNDVLDGGAGADVAVFAGLIADYAVSGWGNNVTVADLDMVADGNDGTDQLAGIETLQFKDGTIAVPTSPPNSAPSGLALVGVVAAPAPSGFAGSAGLSAADTYRLTPNLQWQNGAVWGNVDLSKDIAWTTRMYFGASDAGADGIGFALQNGGTSALGGYGALTSASIGIRFDTYVNSGEPASDFSQFVLNNQPSTQFDAYHNHANLENNAWHDVVIQWAADSQSLSYSLDGAQIASKTYDAVALFGGDATVQFGFGAGTGGLTNEQSVKLVSVTKAVDHFEIDENVSAGTFVGRLVGSDADGDALTYSIVDGAGAPVSHAIFEIAGGNEIRVKSGATVDYEAAASHVLNIKVSDPDGANLMVPVTIGIRNLVDGNEAPTGLALFVDASIPTALMGSAAQISADAFRLTPNSYTQNGAAWGSVDLSNDAIWKTQMYFGGSDGGADGIAFAFQNAGTSVLGGYGVLTSNSFGIRFDTYVNANLGEPGSDFSQFVRNGVTGAQSNQFDYYRNHANLENASWPEVVISWEAASKTLSYSLAGVVIGSKSFDAVAELFGGDSTVQYGFGASTGGAINEHWVKFLSVQRGVSHFEVQENAAGGVLLGRLKGHDRNSGDTLNYSIVDSNGAPVTDSMFAIVNGTELRTKTGAVIDYETATSHDILVKVSDAGGASVIVTVDVEILNQIESGENGLNYAFEGTDGWPQADPDWGGVEYFEMRPAGNSPPITGDFLV